VDNENMDSRWWIVLGGFLAGIAVLASAYGAHGLDKADIGQRRADDFELAARYQTIHAIGLVLTGLIGRGVRRHWCVHIAAVGFLLGIVLFCGGLFGYAIWNSRAFATCVPIGGIAFIVGWVALAIAGWRCKPPASE
jgi:uncharacterized membrane protein YgdD (TMEM256/DUF423 family)